MGGPRWEPACTRLSSHARGWRPQTFRLHTPLQPRTWLETPDFSLAHASPATHVAGDPRLFETSSRGELCLLVVSRSILETTPKCPPRIVLPCFSTFVDDYLEFDIA